MTATLIRLPSRRGAAAALAALAAAMALPAAPAAAATAPPAAGSVAHARAVLDGSPSRLGALRGDAVRDAQWQLAALDAADAWRLSTGAGVTVAVIDSGVDATHPDLTGQVLPGRDLVDPGDHAQIDPVGHGTTVAALIAGRADDDSGVVGLAPRAKVLPVRVLDARNRYDDAMIVAEGVRWAVDHGASVVNLSLGGAGDNEALAEAIDYAFARDVVVVACTGNSGPSMPSGVWYPAREPGVIAVAGLDHQHPDTLWRSSVTGAPTVLAAPATDLTGARPGGYWRVQGTSFAAPLVAATAALIRSRWPHMSAANVVNRLIRTARDLGPLGRDDVFGFGEVDPVAALSATVPAVATNPLDNAPPPGVARFGPAAGVKTGGPVPANAGHARANGFLAGTGRPVNRSDAGAPGGAYPGLLGGLAFLALLTALAAVLPRAGSPPLTAPPRRRSGATAGPDRRGT